MSKIHYNALSCPKTKKILLSPHETHHQPCQSTPLHPHATDQSTISTKTTHLTKILQQTNRLHTGTHPPVDSTPPILILL